MKSIKSRYLAQSYQTRVRIVLGLTIILLAGLFVYLKVVPNGTITYHRSWPRGLASGKGFIYDFKPGERLDSGSEALKIIADPVYFSLYAPRAFDRAEVTIQYRDHLSSTSPVVEVGVLRDKLTGQCDLQPLQNDTVDKYRFSWPRLDDSAGRLILQAEKYYERLTDFEKDLEAGNLKNCPGGITACLATYNYPVATNFRLPDYASIVPTVITQPFRGAHQFYVYFKPGAWRLGFNFVDLNLDAATDPITVTVFSGTEQIATETLKDEQGAVSGQREEKSLIMSGQKAAGLYRVEIKVSDDIVMSQLTSSSDKLSFINKVWPVSGSGKLTMFTDAPQLGVSTINPVSLGQISFGGRKFTLDKTYQPFSYRVAAGINKIIIDEDDLVLENSGVFAFSSDGLVNPNTQKVDGNFQLSDNIKYIIAGYERPLEDNGLKTAQAVLNLKAAASDDNKYTFVISIPGLNEIVGTDNYLEIEKISIRLQGKNIFQKIRELLTSN